MDTPAIPDGAPDYLSVTTSLAMELAAELSTPDEIFERHGISPEDAVSLLNNDAFQRMVREAKKEWDADSNIQDRIKMKAALALEELLIPTFALAKDPRVPPPSRTDAVKLFERLSGAGKQVDDGAGGTGPKFVLTINVGNNEPPKEITGEVIEQEGGE